MQFLYVIKCNEYYKIGVARDMLKRFSVLQVGNPYPLTLVSYYAFANAVPVEQSLHGRFHSKHQSGEWFKLDELDLEALDTICKLMRGVVQSEDMRKLVELARAESEGIAMAVDESDGVEDLTQLSEDVRRMIDYVVKDKDGLFVVTHIANVFGIRAGQVSRAAQLLEKAGLLTPVLKNSTGQNTGRRITEKLLDWIASESSVNQTARPVVY